MKIKNTKKTMDVVFLLDNSGSMAGLEQDTIGGYNSYLEKLKKDDVLVTTVIFNSNHEMIHERKPISMVKKLTNKEYFVGGGTALYDAIGDTINYLNKEKPKEVMFIITTDGQENSSREYRRNDIKQLIAKHKNWEFIYIGADLTAYDDAEVIGIKKRNTSCYCKDEEGVKDLYMSLGKLSKCYLDEDIIEEDWDADLKK